MSRGSGSERIGGVLGPGAVDDDASWARSLLEVSDLLIDHPRPLLEALRCSALDPASHMAVVRLLLVASGSGRAGPVIVAACLERLAVLGSPELVDRAAVFVTSEVLSERLSLVSLPTSTDEDAGLGSLACSAGLALHDNDWALAGSHVQALDAALAASADVESGGRALVRLRDACERAGQVAARKVVASPDDLAPWDLVWSISSGAITTPSILGPGRLLSPEALEVLDGIHPRLGASAVVLADLVRGVAGALATWKLEPTVVRHLGDPEGRVMARALAQRLGVRCGRLSSPDDEGMVIAYDLESLPERDLQVLRLNRHLLIAARDRFDVVADISLGPPPRRDSYRFPWVPRTLWPGLQRLGMLIRSDRSIPAGLAEDLCALTAQLVDQPPREIALYQGPDSAADGEVFASTVRLSLYDGWIGSWTTVKGTMLPPVNRRRLWRANPPASVIEPGRRPRVMPIRIRVNDRRWPGWPS